MTAGMDRPAYELVRVLEALLDDCDQGSDSPDAPNRVNVWAVREVMEDFGGKAHRWSHTRCWECNHTVGFHYDACVLCGCVRTKDEVLAGERDEALDESIERAIQDEGRDEEQQHG